MSDSVFRQNSTHSSFSAPFMKLKIVCLACLALSILWRTSCAHVAKGATEGAPPPINITRESLSGLSYAYTTTGLDGRGTIIQCYVDHDNRECRLVLTPISDGNKRYNVIWISREGTKIAIGPDTEGVSPLRDFIVRQMAEFKARWDVFGDIRNAFYAMQGLDVPVPWNFSKVTIPALERIKLKRDKNPTGTDSK